MSPLGEPTADRCCCRPVVLGAVQQGGKRPRGDAQRMLSSKIYGVAQYGRSTICVDVLRTTSVGVCQANGFRPPVPLKPAPPIRLPARIEKIPHTKIVSPSPRPTAGQQHRIAIIRSRIYLVDDAQKGPRPAGPRLCTHACPTQGAAVGLAAAQSPPVRRQELIGL